MEADDFMEAKDFAAALVEMAEQRNGVTKLRIELISSTAAGGDELRTEFGVLIKPDENEPLQKAERLVTSLLAVVTTNMRHRIEKSRAGAS